MSSQIIVLVPALPKGAQMICAAARAGALPVLDLGYQQNPESCRTSIDDLISQNIAEDWGVRWDLLCETPAKDWPTSKPNQQAWPLLVLAGLSNSNLSLKAHIGRSHDLARQVWVEVCSLGEAQAAQAAGADGLIIKGNEAAGRVSELSTFLLLQLLRDQITIPYYLQGGLGPDTAVATQIAGASGIVLREQLWLTRESPFTEQDRQLWAQLDGSETATAESQDGCYRFFCRANRLALVDLDRKLSEGASIHDSVRECLSAGVDDRGSTGLLTDRLIPLGQEIGFARSLAEQYRTVAEIIGAYRSRLKANRVIACRQKALQPGGPFAKSLHIHYPILQGPMTRVSDVSPFCKEVSAAGALPFLALALMHGPEAHTLLHQTKAQLGTRPWGVGILGFVPAEIRKAQLEVIREVCPPFAIIAGGRPSQAKQLEDLGITTFLHVPSPGLLEVFVRDGARHFILEGRECGGHVGPRSSLTLWQSAIDILLRTKISRPEELHVVFAGGIHDGLSAAMAAAVAAPLVQLGVRIGVLMGSAYLFTEEAVSSGAIVEEYQKQAIHCTQTRLLESGIGHATRCVDTPFTDEFHELRRQLILAGKASDEIRFELESLNVGRLRLASKGLERKPSKKSGKRELQPVSTDEQVRRGIYMIGQVAILRDGVTTVAALHESVSTGHAAFLEQQAPATSLKSAEAFTGFSPVSSNRINHDIAIVGMSGMFPAAHNVRKFWSNIVNRLDLVCEVPADRWRLDDFFSADRSAPDQVYSRWGSFIGDLVFDPLQWFIPPATIAATEPVHFMALNVALEALTDAGLHEGRIPRDRTSVLMAMSGCHDIGIGYVFRTMMRHYLGQVESISPEEKIRFIDELGKVLPEWTEDSFPGVLLNVVAGRISNRFDLRGSNYVVDAACAASLAALHAGVEQLRSGSADCALIGAVDATNGPHTYMGFAQTHALSPTGRSRPFEDSADGIALGEAITAVVIKRLEDAERDGDQIYAVIRGIGTSSDGRARSLTAPHPPGQLLALQRAYADAGFGLDSVSLIEAHGTGTAVGDASEITSLSNAIDSTNTGAQQIAIGSVKSMIGHTKSAAGMVSLVKMALALNQRTLPATIGVTTPTTKINFSKSPFYINTESRPWHVGEGKTRRGGVSAFGFGGTNFHVVLEEYLGPNDPAPTDIMPRAAELFVWTSADRLSLSKRICEFLDCLNQPHLKHFDDLASLAAGVAWEETFAARVAPHRLVLVAKDMDDLRHLLLKAVEALKTGTTLNDPSGLYYSEAPPVDPASVCFLYPGQGSQAVDMLRDLVVSCRWSRDLFQEADRTLQERLGSTSLTQLIYPPPAFTDTERASQHVALSDTQVAQPALGVVELFATEFLKRHGVVPASVAGHSYGEYVALCVAGVMSPVELIRVSSERGRIAAEANAAASGAMAAIQADEERTLQVLSELDLPVHPANFNAPDQTVIAGSVPAVEAAVQAFSSRQIRAKRLPITGAFHTPMMQKSAEVFGRFLKDAELHPPRLPVTSNTTGAAHAIDVRGMRRLLTQHMKAPIQFVRQIQGLKQNGVSIFIEVGPGRVLSSLVERILGAEAIALPLDAPGRSGWIGAGHLLARLFTLGYPLDVAAWFQGRGLPTGTTADVLQAFYDRTVPKPTDWILNAARAVPAMDHQPGSTAQSAVQSAVQSAFRPSPATKAPQQQGAALRQINSAWCESSTPPTPISGPIRPLAGVTPVQAPPRSLPLRAQSTAGRDAPVPAKRPLLSHSAGKSSPPGSPSDQYQQMPSDNAKPTMQSLLEQWLQLQAAQLRITERLLTLQERSLNGGSAPVPLSPGRLDPVQPFSGNGDPTATQLIPITPDQVHLTQVAAQPPAPPSTRPPVAVPMSATARTAPGASSPNPNSAGQTADLSAPLAISVAKTPMSSQLSLRADSEPISVETFKRDLLQAVSNRTGYPISVLNLDMALEAELGIDSIKMIEIFGNLKPYHGSFRIENEDEEDMLERFSKIKTLRNIVELLRLGPDSAGGSVKRLVLKSADAPADQKKNGYPSAGS